MNLVCRDGEETTDFYTDVMGFDLLRVNQRPGKTSYIFHDNTYCKLIFWEFDEEGEQTVVPSRQAPTGRKLKSEGKDPASAEYEVGVHHLSWGVDSVDELNEISDMLEDHSVTHWGPINRHNFEYTLHFQDPSGINLEVNAPGPEAGTLGVWSSTYESGNVPEAEQALEMDDEYIYQEEAGIIKEGSTDGLAKTLESTFWVPNW